MIQRLWYVLFRSLINIYLLSHLQINFSVSYNLIQYVHAELASVGGLRRCLSPVIKFQLQQGLLTSLISLKFIFVTAIPTGKILFSNISRDNVD